MEPQLIGFRALLCTASRPHIVSLLNIDKRSGAACFGFGATDAECHPTTLMLPRKSRYSAASPIKYDNIRSRGQQHETA